MSDSFSADIDTREIVAALDRLGAAAEAISDRVSHDTALRIQAGIRARAQWGATGQTKEAVTVEKIDGGYRIYIGRTNDPEGWARPANLPLWIEYGTRKWLGHPAFFFGPARIEEGPHLRRLAEALQQAIDASGFGA